LKAAAFGLLRPSDLAAAVAALGDAQTRPLAGGQSLGPMLNYRVTQPRCLVQIARLPELYGFEAGPDALTIGAAVTHAAIEDGLVPDIGRGILARVAGGIAYRAVRNRGTIGGSLCHADPAADWVTVLIALGATALLRSASGVRALAIGDFIRGPYQTALRSGEMLQAVRVPLVAASLGWGYAKLCRKPGEFAHAMAAVLRRADGTRRVVIGASGASPLRIEAALSLDEVFSLVHFSPVDRHIALANIASAWHAAME